MYLSCQVVAEWRPLYFKTSTVDMAAALDFGRSTWGGLNQVRTFDIVVSKVLQRTAA